MRKTIYTGKLPTSKKRIKKSFGVFFLILQLTTLERKTEKKQAAFLGFSQSFSNTQEINLAWIVQMKKCGHRQLE